MSAPQNSKLAVIRALGPLETFVSAHHLLKTSFRTILTGRYATPTNIASQALADTLTKAVALTVLEHPLLQPGLAEEDSKQPTWVRLQTIDLASLITWVHVPDDKEYEESLRQSLIRHHNTPFASLETVPAWRITVLRPERESAGFIDVIFHFSHTNADGMSGKIFHKTLHRMLNKVSNRDQGVLSTLKLHGDILQLPQDSQLPLTQEELMQFPISVSFILSAGWKGLRPSWFVPSHYAHWAPVQASPNETTLEIVTTDAMDLQRILSACRKHHTTITGLLHALVFVSLCRRLPNQPGFVGGSTINMRRFVENKCLKPDDVIGNFVTLMTHDFDMSLTASLRDAWRESDDLILPMQDWIWEIAAAVRAELKQKLDRGTSDDMMGLVGLMAKGDFRSVLKGELKKTRELSWEVSNLGALDTASLPGPGWPVQRLISSQSAVANGAAILVFPISVQGGSLCTTVSAQKSVVEPSLTEGLASDLASWLKALSQSAG